MCGIAGIISVNKEEVSHAQLKAMTDIIDYRGPDDQGQWISENGHAGLGHRRLSIIDLSENGRQPMHYLNRYSIVFNGEIYNYIELKQTLIQKGYSFQTESDTEVLMALYAKEKKIVFHFWMECLLSLFTTTKPTRSLPHEIVLAKNRFIITTSRESAFYLAVK